MDECVSCPYLHHWIRVRVMQSKTQLLTNSPHTVVAIDKEVLCDDVVLLENRSACRTMFFRLWVAITVT